MRVFQKKNTRVFLKKRATNSEHKQTRKEKVYELEEVFGGVVWVLGCAFGGACRGWMLADGQWRWNDDALIDSFEG